MITENILPRKTAFLIESKRIQGRNERIERGAIAVLDHNKPAFYCVPPAMFHVSDTLNWVGNDEAGVSWSISDAVSI